MELSNTCSEMEQQLKTCKVMARQDTTISVPVSIKPKVSTGIANVYCCGDEYVGRILHPAAAVFYSCGGEI